MKAQLYIVALPLFAVAALAQSPVPPQSTPTAQHSKATNAPAAPASNNGTAAEMMTRNYSGTLMDASCVTAGPATAPANSPAKPAPDTTSAKPAATADPGQTCSVTTSSTQFAIKLKDGQTVRLDDVGNQRVQDALKTKKKWTDAAASGKPIHVDASGILNGDKLIAMSIN